jgi:hypothetical protein
LGKLLVKWVEIGFTKMESLSGKSFCLLTSDRELEKEEGGILVASFPVDRGNAILAFDARRDRGDRFVPWFFSLEEQEG